MEGIYENIKLDKGIRSSLGMAKEALMFEEHNLESASLISWRNIMLRAEIRTGFWIL